MYVFEPQGEFVMSIYVVFGMACGKEALMLDLKSYCISHLVWVFFVYYPFPPLLAVQCQHFPQLQSVYLSSNQKLVYEFLCTTDRNSPLVSA